MGKFTRPQLGNAIVKKHIMDTFVFSSGRVRSIASLCSMVIPLPTAVINNCPGAFFDETVETGGVTEFLKLHIKKNFIKNINLKYK